MSIEIKEALITIGFGMILVSIAIGLVNIENAINAQTKAITNLSQHTIVYTGYI